MAVVRFHLISSLSPAQALATLTDFGPRPRGGLADHRRRPLHGP